MHKSWKKIRRSATNPVRAFKNLSGIGLLQRSKTARKVALVAAAGTAAYFAAPYAAAAGKAVWAGGKNVLGSVTGGGRQIPSGISSLYAQPFNNMNATAIENTPPPQSTIDSLYGPELVPGQTGRAVLAAGTGAGMASSCASVGGDVGEVGYYMMIASLVVYFVVSHTRKILLRRAKRDIEI